MRNSRSNGEGFHSRRGENKACRGSGFIILQRERFSFRKGSLLGGQGDTAFQERGTIGEKETGR